MEITYLGHACFLFDINGTRVLFDPFISPNPLASDINVDDIKCDYILLSHGHGDHVADAEQIAKKNDATLVATYEITNWFEGKGVKKTHPLNTGGKLTTDFGTVKMVNAIHSSSLPDGSYGGSAAGFVVQAEGKTFYYAGDTALTYDMKLIAEQFKVDFALLPIGDNFTMDIHDAMQAARMVDTKKVVAMHYDTFPYIKIDQAETKKVAQDAGIELVLMKIGETIKL